MCRAQIDREPALLGATCGAPGCERARAGERRRERRARQGALFSLVDERLATADPTSGVERIDALAKVLVPANRTRVVELPRHRKRRFREHLARVVAEAFALRDAGTLPPPTPLAERGPAPGTTAFLLLAGACATCRGKCCKQGGDRAFVDVPTIARYLATHPEATAAEVIAAYLAHLGERTYERACVYQGERGCLLPREMRARICNDYQCDGLEDLREALTDTAPRHAVVAAIHDERVMRVAVVGQSGTVALADETEPSRARIC